MTPITLSLATPETHGHKDAEAGIPSQRVELSVTREWLRAKIWKLGIPGQRSSSEFVASKENPHWQFDEPLSIGRDILGELQGLSSVLQDNWSGILVCGLVRRQEHWADQCRTRSCATSASACTTSSRSCRPEDDLGNPIEIRSFKGFWKSWQRLAGVVLTYWATPVKVVSQQDV